MGRPLSLAVVIVDAGLRHKIDDAGRLETLLDEQIVLQAQAGTDADYFVLETAGRHGAKVVSNDVYAPYKEKYPWVRNRRVPLMIVHGKVELYKEELGGGHPTHHGG